MKRTLTVTVLACFALAITSCTKKAARTTSAHYVSATIGSSGSFSSADTAFATANGYGNPSGYYLNVWGRSSAGAVLQVGIPGFNNTAGSWSLTGYPNAVGSYQVTSGTMIGSAHGSVSVTSVTPNLIGSFTFTGTDSVVYTGSFNLNAPPY